MILPAAAFYDYQAKYSRDDTRYEFDTGLPQDTLATLGRYAQAMFQAVGCRHLARVDFIIDTAGKPWFLEINTLPGFTDHSLLPKAAAQAGLEMPALCNRLVQLAMQD
jgi:D-alanine-D-alanine ligase